MSQIAATEIVKTPMEMKTPKPVPPEQPPLLEAYFVQKHITVLVILAV